MGERTNRNAPGVFVTFEGGDGSGKTTHIRILGERLESLGYDVLCVREPGGTFAGEQLRGILLDRANSDLCAKSELLIYEAARAQIVCEKIAPALAAGKVVLCDRFADSTIAYQGYGRGLDIDFIRGLNAFATGGIVPDATILLTCEGVDEGMDRVGQRDVADRIELAGDDFHMRVAKGFEALAVEEADRFFVVNTCAPLEEASARIFDIVAPLFPRLDGTPGD